jgi:hypothetical protein
MGIKWWMPAIKRRFVRKKMCHSRDFRMCFFIWNGATTTATATKAEAETDPETNPETDPEAN